MSIDLGKVQRKQASIFKLTEELRRSLLICEIWPEAFDYGGTITFGGQMREGAYLSAFFKSSVLERGHYKLSADELLAWAPDAKIHKEFK